jgi:TP901 family phage tail tape measure protein
MSFDAGALIFKIQTAGAALAQSELERFDSTVTRVGRSAKQAKPEVDGLGNASDKTGQKARAAKKPLDDQAKATDDVGAKSKKAAEEQRKQKEATEGQVQAAKTLSLALIAAGAATAALLTMSVVQFTTFDAQMSNVRAATMSTTQEQEDLGEAALQAGADTAYSATQAAAAEEELAKAGQTVSEIVGGSLSGALALAAAGQLQVARSAEIMATTLKQYGLEAEDAAHVSDVLAAGAGKAQGSVDDLALALQYVGPVAAGLGISLEETGGSLAYLASQGILGEKAGTGLRGVLMSLTAPSAIATKTMAAYGIEIFDAQGNMKSLAAVSEILHSRLSGLTEAERSAALGRIFGNEQITTARILYAGGADAIEKWTAAVDDSGYAAEQARIRQDNLAGDIEKLGGAWETALIRNGSGANDVLRDQVQIITMLVEWYGELPAWVHTSALGFGVLTAAVLLTSGASLGLVARFTELRRQLELNNISMGKTALIGGAVGLALAGVVTVVTILAQRQAEAEQRAKSFADTLEDGSHRVTQATRDMTVSNLQAQKAFLWMSQGSAADAAEQLGISLDTVADAALNERDALDELSVYTRAADGDTQALDQVMREHNLTKLEAVGLVNSLVTGIREQGTALDEAKRLEKQHAEATANGASASERSAAATKTATEAYLESAGSVDDLNSQLRELIDNLNEANGNSQDAVSANANYRAGLAGIAERAAEAGVSLDQATVAGSANASMLADVAADAQRAAEAQFEVDKASMSAEEAAQKYSATLAAQRQEFIDSAVAAGYNKDEVIKLADEVFKLPSKHELAFVVETTEAQKKLQAIADTLTAFKSSAYGVNLSGYIRSLDRKDGGIVEYYANGGTREHHVAQIARAGTYRVWAEDETDGEGYIPFAISKRARSEAIMHEIAARFGGRYIPGGGRSFADGGFYAPPAPAAVAQGTLEAHFHIEGSNFQPPEIVRAAMFALEEKLRDAQP